MTAILEAVRPIELAEIREARVRIAQTIVRAPLVRLQLGPGFPELRLKLQHLQPINAYKLRGAANAVALLLFGQLRDEFPGQTCGKPSPAMPEARHNRHFATCP